MKLGRRPGGIRQKVISRNSQGRHRREGWSEVSHVDIERKTSERAH